MLYQKMSTRARTKLTHINRKRLPLRSLLHITEAGRSPNACVESKFNINFTFSILLAITFRSDKFCYVLVADHF